MEVIDRIEQGERIIKATVVEGGKLVKGGSAASAEAAQ
jgi:hypothetical protein